MRIGILAPMPSELRPVVKRLGLRPAASSPVGRMVHEGRVGDVSVVAAMTGIGPDAAAAATRAVLDAGDLAVDHVVVVGIAGGIADGQSIGDVVPVDVVIDDRTGAEYRPHPLGAGAAPVTGGGSLHTSPEFIADAARVAALRARGVVALDMETAAVAAVCEERGVPWSVFRTISDRAGDGLADEAVFGLARPDGSPDLRAVARFVIRHPTRIAHLVRLGRDMSIATKSAAAAAATAIERTAQGSDGD